jgi:hypothetical protein
VVKVQVDERATSAANGKTPGISTIPVENPGAVLDSSFTNRPESKTTAALPDGAGDSLERCTKFPETLTPVRGEDDDTSDAYSDSDSGWHEPGKEIAPSENGRPLLNSYNSNFVCPKPEQAQNPSSPDILSDPTNENVQKNLGVYLTPLPLDDSNGSTEDTDSEEAEIRLTSQNVTPSARTKTARQKANNPFDMPQTSVLSPYIKLASIRSTGVLYPHTEIDFLKDFNRALSYAKGIKAKPSARGLENFSSKNSFMSVGRIIRNVHE